MIDIPDNNNPACVSFTCKLAITNGNTAALERLKKNTTRVKVSSVRSMSTEKGDDAFGGFADDNPVDPSLEERSELVSLAQKLKLGSDPKLLRPPLISLDDPGDSNAAGVTTTFGFVKDELLRPPLLVRSPPDRTWRSRARSMHCLYYESRL